MSILRVVVVVLAGVLVVRIPDPSTYTLAALALAVLILEPRGKER